MSAVVASLAGLHWLGLVAIVIGYLLSLARGAVSPLLLWAARIQLLLGVLLAAVAVGGNRESLPAGWVVTKLLVAVCVLGLCEVGTSRAKQGDSQPALLHGAAVLTAINVVVATVFR